MKSHSATGLNINAAPLKVGKHKLTFTPSAESLELEPDRFEAITVTVEMDLSVGQAWLTLQTAADAHLICDRTLIPFIQRVEGSFRLLFTNQVEADEESDEDIRSYPEDQVLEITDAVRDTILLSVPIRKIAPKAAGLEIQTRFGASNEDETDPRWEALKGLNFSNDQ